MVSMWSRTHQRLVHLALATALGVFVYSPLSSVRTVEVLVQTVVFPALAVSGVLLWRGARLRNWLRRR